MPKAGNRKAGVMCAYCGIEPSTTGKGDHVIPRALFLEPFPEDMVTVPACRACNDKKAPLDTYLREVLVADISVADQRVAMQLLDGKVARSIAKNRSKLARETVAGVRLEPVFTPLGIYVGDAVSVAVDGGMLHQGMTYIARGLFYHVRNRRIPADYRFDVTRYEPDGIRPLWDHLAPKSQGAGKIGEGVFDCLYLFAEEDPDISFWLLVFYDRIAYGVASLPQAGGRTL